MKHEPTPVLPGRRRWFAAAAAVGAAAAAVSVLPVAPRSPVTEAPAPAAAPRRGGGYHASAHVQRYYDTTRV